jgi:hypothetical protein
MSQIVGAENGLGLARLVGAPRRLDIHQRQQHALGVAQRDAAAHRGAFGESGGDIERDWHRPERAALQAHTLAHRVIIALAQEPVERRETAIHQQFEIADLALRQVPAWQVASLALQPLNPIRRREQFRRFTRIANGARAAPAFVVHLCPVPSGFPARRDVCAQARARR